MKVWINGRLGGRLDAQDRGLQYGDGVFESMRVRRRRIRLLDFHLERLYCGLQCLGIMAPAHRSLRAELVRVALTRSEAVLKLIVTRGAGPRGYRPTGQERSTRIVMLAAMASDAGATRPVRVRLCKTRLAVQPRLAGLKTLNRLESVIARCEWRDRRWWEGLMQDTDGNIVCGTMSNLFIRRGARLITPLLDRCGVAGVMRRWVLQNARLAGFDASQRRLRWRDLESAEEVFLSNAVIGVKPVGAIEGPPNETLRFACHEAAERLQLLLEKM